MKKLLSRPELISLGLLAVAVVILPVVFNGDRFMVGLLGYTMVFALFALSIHVMLSWTGEIALGHSLYFGFGAYVSSILMKDTGLPFVSATVIAIGLAAALAVILGLITLRLTGAYFAIVSWGLSAVAVVIANSGKITGGALGLIGVPAATIGPLSLNTPSTYLWVSGAVLVVIVVVLARIRMSSVGVRSSAAKMNRRLAESLGAPVYRDRVVVFVLSSSLAALAGALAVTYFRIVTPNILGVTTTVDALVMVLLGGVGFLLGPVLGALFFRLVPEAIHLSAEVRAFIFALLIILVMMLAPGGVPDIVKRIRNRIHFERAQAKADKS